MNISSILITIVGIIIIIALYVVSRIGQSKLPSKETSLLPDIKDENGDVFTSVLDDIPASDGISPVASKPMPKNVTTKKRQLVLFISTNNGEALEGNLIKSALKNNGLTLGDKEIYHYPIDSVFENKVTDNNKIDHSIQNSNDDKEQNLTSLFRVANGVEPWTLTDNDLDNSQLLGLSLVMLLPTVIDNDTALKIFLDKADSIAQQCNGILKNQKQQVLSEDERANFFSN